MGPGSLPLADDVQSAVRVGITASLRSARAAKADDGQRHHRDIRAWSRPEFRWTTHSAKPTRPDDGEEAATLDLLDLTWQRAQDAPAGHMRADDPGDASDLSQPQDLGLAAVGDMGKRVVTRAIGRTQLQDGTTR